MCVYLNTISPLNKFKELLRSKYFVDKTMLIEKINEILDTRDKFLCITKPRRFGKSSVADMLGAYYSKAFNSEDVFNKLNISKVNNYKEHLNKYNVIYMTLNKLPKEGNTYFDYINMIQGYLIKDITKKFPFIKAEDYYSIDDIFSATGEKFVFIIDEWDYIFSSALNMFNEYTMLNYRIYAEYFGFTEEEVKGLCSEENSVSFKEIKEWYNGYTTNKGKSIYNPRSVVCALRDDYCKSYWTSTGAMDEVLFYLKYNIAEVRNDIIEMVSKNSVEVYLDEEYRAGQDTLETKEEIYSAMIVYGFLSYYDGILKIPNKELMKEFEKALRDKSFGKIVTIIGNSKKMLEATLNKDTITMKKIIDDIHNSEIPIFQYNDENSLSCVVSMAYLFAREEYRIEREEKTGKGYADFVFHPRKRNKTAFILELKKDTKPIKAINQMKEKDYAQKLREENEDKKILAVAICYNSKTKEHECMIEEI